MIEIEMTMADVAKILGVDSFDDPFELDVSDLGIKIETPNGFKEVSHFHVMPQVSEYFEFQGLKGTSEHKILQNDKWVPLKDVSEAKRINEKLSVVDMTVPDGRCYIANGVVNHNTTPGGKQ